MYRDIKYIEKSFFLEEYYSIDALHVILQNIGLKKNLITFLSSDSKKISEQYQFHQSKGASLSLNRLR